MKISFYYKKNGTTGKTMDAGLCETSKKVRHPRVRVQQHFWSVA